MNQDFLKVTMSLIKFIHEVVDGAWAGNNNLYKIHM